MKYKVELMKLDRHADLLEFWKDMPGVWLSDDDSYESMAVYLKRNPDTNYVVLNGDEIIGTVKCSHDGRRGYIHHLAVKEEYRKQGIARELVDRCINGLKEQVINKYRVFVLDSNPAAIAFWKHIGFEEQVYDYRTLQKNS
ncbi:MAG: GNAT family N-acetyltransferase [Dehalococcoidales bacterium]